MTFATALTLLRLVLIVPVGVLVLGHGSGVAALIVFVAAAATDYFDGFVARRFGQVTSLGARLDASVDKVFIYAILGALLFRGTFVTVLVATAFVRDVLVELLRHRAAARSHVIPANRWGKSKFSLQCLSVAIALIAQSSSNAAQLSLVANIVLAMAVLASIPGVFVVWNSARRASAAA
jgi:CDP-diacylglycerol--glycerol-3-phosphate 3-phosphatidyltransferase